MKNIYLKIASHLDKLGKYKQADSLEKYLKTSQTITPLRSTSDPLLQLDDFFNALGYQQLTQGPLAQFTTTGAQRNIADVVELDQLTPQQIYQLSKTPEGMQTIQNRFTELAGIIASYSQGANFNTLDNLLTLVRNELIIPFEKSGQPLVAENSIKNNVVLQENIVNALKNALLNENDVTKIQDLVSRIEASFSQYATFVNLTDGIIKRGVGDAFAEMATSPNVLQKNKSELIKNNAVLKKYI